jgi:hypothetical protein
MDNILLTQFPAQTAQIAEKQEKLCLREDHTLSLSLLVII